MTSEPKGNWSTPPVFLLALRLKQFILTQQKKQLEEKLNTATNALRIYTEKAKRAANGK